MPRRLRLDPEAADARGLVAVGGDLQPGTLLDAYGRGIFPWYDESRPVCWWSPDPRAIIPLDRFHVSHRLARTIRAGQFTVSFNREFAAVMRGCSVRPEGTWITPDMMAAYQRLHEMGHAHSVEAWQGPDLVGGVYGVTLGGLFSAESMYHCQSNASSVALVGLVNRLRVRGFTLLDVQMVTPHTAKVGAVEIPRHDYLQRLRDAVGMDVTFCDV